MTTSLSAKLGYRLKGSHGGQNGIKGVFIEQCGTDTFPQNQNGNEGQNQIPAGIWPKWYCRLDLAGIKPIGTSH